jgi:hypothetical protein
MRFVAVLCGAEADKFNSLADLRSYAPRFWRGTSQVNGADVTACRSFDVGLYSSLATNS